MADALLGLPEGGLASLSRQAKGNSSAAFLFSSLEAYAASPERYNTEAKEKEESARRFFGRLAKLLYEALLCGTEEERCGQVRRVYLWYAFNERRALPPYCWRAHQPPSLATTLTNTSHLNATGRSTVRLPTIGLADSEEDAAATSGMCAAVDHVDVTLTLKADPRRPRPAAPGSRADQRLPRLDASSRAAIAQRNSGGRTSPGSYASAQHNQHHIVRQQPQLLHSSQGERSVAALMDHLSQPQTRKASAHATFSATHTRPSGRRQNIQGQGRLLERRSQSTSDPVSPAMLQTRPDASHAALRRTSPSRPSPDSQAQARAAPNHTDALLALIATNAKTKVNRRLKQAASVEAAQRREANEDRAAAGAHSSPASVVTSPTAVTQGGRIRQAATSKRGGQDAATPTGGFGAAAELGMLASQVALASAQKTTASTPSTGQLPGPTTLNVVPMQRRLQQQREERLQAMSRGNTLAMTLGVPIQSLKVKLDGRVALVSSGNENVELELPASMVSRFGGHHPGDDAEGAAVEEENGQVDEGVSETHEHSGNDSQDVVAIAGGDTPAVGVEIGSATPATKSTLTTMRVDLDGAEDATAVPMEEDGPGQIVPNGDQLLQPSSPREESCREGSTSRPTTDAVQAETFPSDTKPSPARRPVTADVEQIVESRESAAGSEEWERSRAETGSGQANSTPGQDGNVEPQDQPQPTESLGVRLEKRASGECEIGQGGAKSSSINSTSSSDRMMDRLNAAAQSAMQDIVEEDDMQKRRRVSAVLIQSLFRGFRQRKAMRTIADLGLTRGDAIQQFYMGRRRAIAIFRRAEMECYPLPVQYDWIREYHTQRRLLVDNFKIIVGAKQEQASFQNLRTLFKALATTIGYEPTEKELTKAVAIVFKRSEEEIRTTLHELTAGEKEAEDVFFFLKEPPGVNLLTERVLDSTWMRPRHEGVDTALIMKQVEHETPLEKVMEMMMARRLQEKFRGGPHVSDCLSDYSVTSDEEEVRTAEEL